MAALAVVASQFTPFAIGVRSVLFRSTDARAAPLPSITGAGSPGTSCRAPECPQRRLVCAPPIDAFGVNHLRLVDFGK